MLLALTLFGVTDSSCREQLTDRATQPQSKPVKCEVVTITEQSAEHYSNTWIAIDLPLDAWPGVISLPINRVADWTQGRSALLIGRGSNDSELAERCAELGLGKVAVVLAGGWRQLIEHRRVPLDKRAFYLSDREASALYSAGTTVLALTDNGTVVDAVVPNRRLAKSLSALPKVQAPLMLIDRVGLETAEIPPWVFLVSQSPASSIAPSGEMYTSDLAYKRPCFWR